MSKQTYWLRGTPRTWKNSVWVLYYIDLSGRSQASRYEIHAVKGVKKTPYLLVDPDEKKQQFRYLRDAQAKGEEMLREEIHLP